MPSHLKRWRPSPLGGVVCLRAGLPSGSGELLGRLTDCRHQFPGRNFRPQGQLAFRTRSSRMVSSGLQSPIFRAFVYFGSALIWPFQRPRGDVGRHVDSGSFTRSRSLLITQERLVESATSFHTWRTREEKREPLSLCQGAASETSWRCLHRIGEIMCQVTGIWSVTPAAS